LYSGNKVIVICKFSGGAIPSRQAGHCRQTVSAGQVSDHLGYAFSMSLFTHSL